MMMSGKKDQLFLLHFAGGSCYSFDFLKKHLGTEVEFISLELPGRGKRANEPLVKTKEAAIQDYLKQIKALRSNQPYLIVGHSMGATLSLSVAKRMEDLNDAPYQLIVSGNSGPGVKKSIEEEEKGKKYLMNDEDFKKELRELGGVPEEVLENNELYGYFSPILRADFEVLEQDVDIEEGIHLKIPIYALMGSEETNVNEIGNWERFTATQFQHQVLEGGHFFINDHPEAVANVIKAAVREKR